LPTDLKSLARSYTETAIQTLGGIAASSESDAARVAACGMLLDRGWGRPAQQIEHTGKDGDSEIHLIMRTITEGKK
jgi:hypothetical protein